jgi:hypothetical protein
LAVSALSLAVVGADFPNKRGPGRRFEIEICAPGEPVQLVPEPKNPADPRAVAVFSARAVQIGYLTAERCGWIGSMIAAGREIEAVFQQKAAYGAVIRVAFDGEPLALPSQMAAPEPQDDSGFYPDWIPPDE